MSRKPRGPGAVRAQRTKACLRIGGLCAVALLATRGIAAAAESQLPNGVTISPPPPWVELIEIDPDGVSIPETVADGLHYLLFDTQTRVDGGLEVTFRRSLERIVNDGGLEGASQVSIEFDPTYQSLEVHTIRIVRHGTPASRLSADALKVIQREERLESSLYDGELSVLVFLDDLRVGDVIEVASTIRSKNPVLEGRFFDSFATGWSVPVHAWRHRLLWPAGRSLHRRNFATNIEPSVQQRGEFTELVWQAVDTPVVPPESGTPGWYDLYGWVQLGEFESWSQLVGWGTRIFTPPDDPSFELLEQVEQFSAAGVRETQVLEAIRFVQDQVRYLGFEMGEKSHRPSNPNDVFLRRFGDCKDKALLLVTILRAMGIDAHPALVNTFAEHGIDTWLPSPYAFDHTIVTFELDGRRHWIDVTLSGQGGSLTTIHLPDYQRALVLAPETTELTTLPTRDLTRPSLAVREVFTLTADGGPVDYLVETTREGRSADSIRNEFMTTSRDEIARSYLNYYTRTYPSIVQLDDVELEDDRQANIAVVREYYRIDEFWSISDDEANREAGFWAYTIDEAVSKPVTAVRTAPLSVPHPLFIRHTTVINFPSEWEVEPMSESLSGPGLQFTLQSTYDDETLTLDYSLRSTAAWLTAGDTPEYIATVEEISNSLGYSLWESTAGTESQTAALSVVNWSIASTTGVFCVLLAFGWIKAYRYRPPAPRAEAARLRTDEHGTFLHSVFELETQEAENPQPPIDTNLRGLRGWLVLVGIGLVLSPFRIGFDMVGNFSAYSVSTWNALTSPGTADYHPLWAPVLIFELLGNLTMLSASILMLALYFGRRRTFPRFFIAYLIGSFLFLLTDSITAAFVPEFDPAAVTELAVATGRAFIPLLIWVPYFLVSQRVKATFVS